MTLQGICVVKKAAKVITNVNSKDEDLGYNLNCQMFSRTDDVRDSGARLFGCIPSCLSVCARKRCNL